MMKQMAAGHTRERYLTCVLMSIAVRLEVVQRNIISELVQRVFANLCDLGKQTRYMCTLALAVLLEKNADVIPRAMLEALPVENTLHRMVQMVEVEEEADPFEGVDLHGVSSVALDLAVESTESLKKVVVRLYNNMQVFLQRQFHVPQGILC